MHKPFLVCGIDEVGRGALAGPLIAVAALFRTFWPAYRVCLKSTDIGPYGFSLAGPPPLSSWKTGATPVPGITDSKLLSHGKRRWLFHQILRYEDLVDFGIGEVSVEEINSAGIERANQLAFQRAVQDLKEVPWYLLVDGDKPVAGWDLTKQWVQSKGDKELWPIGAASILAKTIRDDYMTELAKDYPDYEWQRNAGYGSPLHKGMLKRIGPCPLHRKQFIRNIVGARI